MREPVPLRDPNVAIARIAQADAQ